MRLLEFQATSLQFKDFLLAMVKKFKLERVGRGERVYNVGPDLGVIYIVNGGPKAIGLTWHRGTNLPASVYVWKVFDQQQAPDFMVDIPQEATVANMHEIVNFVRSPKIGLLESTIMEARQVSPEEFKKLAMQKFGAKASRLTLVDLNQLARESDVRIPGAIRHDSTLKVDPHHWNLSDSDPEEINQNLSQELGGEIESNPNKHLDPAYTELMQLSKVKELQKLDSQNKLYLMGRNAKNHFFRIPGVDQILAQLGRMLSNQVDQLSDAGQSSMEEQYHQLQERVRLIASGRSQFIKSLLITGAPSSGKTFTVMQTIKEEGLQEGTDYVVKKGRITDTAMYRTLIEQIDGLVIFDDCDSVVESKNGVNMLKGALDTDPVREISYDVQNATNTAVMTAEQREEFVNRVSRIFRGEPLPSDMEAFSVYLNKAKKKKKSGDDEEEADDYEDDESDYEADLHALQQYFSRRMPNKIDFKGRIIFISNMEDSEWDSAILTRAFHVNMNFSDAEMLDYIDNIKQHIKTPNLTEEEKQEVMDYLRELWSTGNLRRPVNFRLIQQCFDLRLTTDWKKLMRLL